MLPRERGKGNCQKCRLQQTTTYVALRSHLSVSPGAHI